MVIGQGGRRDTQHLGGHGQLAVLVLLFEPWPLLGFDPEPLDQPADVGEPFKGDPDDRLVTVVPVPTCPQVEQLRDQDEQCGLFPVPLFSPAPPGVALPLYAVNGHGAGGAVPEVVEPACGGEESGVPASSWVLILPGHVHFSCCDGSADRPVEVYGRRRAGARNHDYAGAQVA